MRDSFTHSLHLLTKTQIRGQESILSPPPRYGVTSVLFPMHLASLSLSQTWRTRCGVCVANHALLSKTRVFVGLGPLPARYPSGGTEVASTGDRPPGAGPAQAASSSSAAASSDPQPGAGSRPEGAEPDPLQGTDDPDGDLGALVLSYMLPLPASAPARNPWTAGLESHPFIGRVCHWIEE